MYTDNSLITPEITDLLKKKEEILLIHRSNRTALMRNVRTFLLVALVSAILFNVYLLTTGMLHNSTLMSALFIILFWNAITILALTLAFRAYKRMDKAFYALTNMRVIFTTLNSYKKIDSVYLKDIHEVSPHKNTVKVDLNDRGDYGKRYRFIQGVNDPADLCDQLNDRLETFRLGPQ